MTLDEAWAAVEAALPEYWRIRSLISLSALSDRWEIVAAEQGQRKIVTAQGDSPAAALQALATRLKKPA